MPRRTALLFALLVCAAAVAWILRGERSTPEDASAAQSGEPRPSPRGAAPITTRETTSVADPHAPAPIAPDERHTVAPPRGRGSLAVEMVHGGIPIANLPLVLGALPESQEIEDDRRIEFASTLAGVQPEQVDVAEGSWRLFVVRGPGDAPRTTSSAHWSVELGDDVVRVPRDGAVRQVVRIVRGVESPPERGTARIRGHALLDGEPAAGCMVVSDPLTPCKIQRVAADGSFDLGEVAAGLQRVQLSPPVERVRRGEAVFVVGAIDVAPSPGDSLTVRIEARTGSVEIETVDAAGLPISASLMISAFPSFIVPGFGAVNANTVRSTDATGHDVMKHVPPCTLQVIARSSGAKAVAIPIRVVAGEVRRERLVLHPLVLVSGLVDFTSFGVVEPRRGATIFFEGPIRDTTITDRHGNFATDDLIAGRYEVLVLLPDLRRLPAEPLEVGGEVMDAIRIVAAPGTGR